MNSNANTEKSSSYSSQAHSKNLRGEIIVIVHIGKDGRTNKRPIQCILSSEPADKLHQNKTVLITMENTH